MKSNISSALVRVLPVGFSVMLMAGLSGCAHQVYDVRVDAIQNPEIATGFSYRIIENDATQGALDPNRAEAVQVVKAALAGRGMYEAPRPDQAEVEVIVNYGVGPQRLKIEKRNPELGWSVARAPLAIIPLQRPDGSITYAAVSAEALDVDGTYRGHRVLRGSHVYEKYLSISARETAAAVGGARKPAEAWQVQATIEDMKDSITGYLPVLAGAAADYLGTNTEKEQKLRLRDDAEVVAFVKSQR